MADDLDDLLDEFSDLMGDAGGSSSKLAPAPMKKAAAPAPAPAPAQAPSTKHQAPTAHGVNRSATADDIDSFLSDFDMDGPPSPAIATRAPSGSGSAPSQV